MKKILGLSVIVSSVVMAGAYKVPEQSVNSTALGAAYVAHTTGADTAYFNPANMAFMADKQFMEAGVTLAHLPRSKFSGANTRFSGQSEVENLYLPNLHYVAKPIGDFRWGASLTVPGGLTKRWETPVQKASAEEFTLKVLELNPVASYKVTDNFALAGGVRLIHAEGVVKSDASAVSASKATRDMEGDTQEFGYNLAMTYKPMSDVNMAVTYRSKVDLDLEGEADISAVFSPLKSYDATVSVPLPAALNVSLSKTWQDRYTVELNYEKTYWSAYSELDFNYGSAIHPFLVPAFDDPKAKNWKDTDTFRIGLTAEVSDKLTLMAGYAKDESPIPKKYVSYELPDSDANIYTFGLRIQANENLSYGVAYLRDEKDSFTLASGENEPGITGKFSGGGADLFTMGVAYNF